jgi:hypothetical protein
MTGDPAVPASRRNIGVRFLRLRRREVAHVALRHRAAQAAVGVAQRTERLTLTVIEIAHQPLGIVRRDVAEVGRVAQILGLEIERVDLIAVGQPARTERQIVARLKIFRGHVDGAGRLRCPTRAEREVLAAHGALAHRDRCVVNDAVIVGVDRAVLDQHRSDREPAHRNHVADRARLGMARQPQRRCRALLRGERRGQPCHERHDHGPQPRAHDPSSRFLCASNKLRFTTARRAMHCVTRSTRAHNSSLWRAHDDGQRRP